MIFYSGFDGGKRLYLLLFDYDVLGFIAMQFDLFVLFF